MNNICGNPEQNGGANVSDCWARFHDTVAFGGTKPSPIWQLSPKYSVETRLLDALQQLHAATPTAKWDRFILPANRGVNWRRVVISGHSQGAGHAAYIAYARQTARASVSLLMMMITC